MAAPTTAPFPTVAILTVVYNDLQALQATCQAVQALDYPHLAHYIQDGASTDGTPGWLAEANLPRTQYASEPDRGLYDAMNKALAWARSQGHEFVWFLNAGDFPATPTVLSNAFDTMGEHDLIYGDTELIDSAGNSLGLRVHKPLPRRLKRRHMRLGMVVSHQSMIVRTSLAPNFDTRYKIAADIDWTIRFLGKTQRTRNAGIVISRFAIGGTSSQHRRASWGERFHILRRHFGFGPALYAHGEILLRAIGRAFSPATRPQP